MAVIVAAAMGVTDAHGDRVHGAGPHGDRVPVTGSDGVVMRTAQAGPDLARDRPRDTRPRGAEAPGALDALTVAVEGRCSGCGSPLATDQRYCLECGQRRGTALSPSPPPSPRAGLHQPAAGAAPIRSRGPSSAAVIAGIATLVLAMGVGVEIGRLASHGAAIVAGTGRPEVIDLAGAGAGAGSTDSTAASGSSASQPASGSSATHGRARSHRRSGAAHQGRSTPASVPKPTAKAVQRAQSAASSVLGGGAGQSNATVSTGQSCASGTAGCQNGHFTGNYFGP